MALEPSVSPAGPDPSAGGGGPLPGGRRPSAPPGSGASKWWTLTAAVLGTFMLMLDLSVVNVALPVIRQELDAGFEEVQWVLDAYALTLAVFLLTAGALADTLGRKKIFQVGFVVFTLASLACGVSNTGLALDISRGAQGVGGAVLFAVAPALISHQFRGRERAVAFSVFGAIIGLAVALGPLIGAALVTTASWRWIFYLNIPIGVFAIVITAVFVRESCDPRARGVDVPGLLVLSVALLALVLGLIRGPQDGWSDPKIIGLGVLAVAGLALFVVVERRRGPAAMLDMSLFGNVTFVGLALVALFAYMAGTTSIFLEANYVENVLGLSAWETGVRFLPLTFGMLVAGTVAGMVMNRIPTRLLLFGCGAFLCAAMLLVLLADQDSSWTALLPSMIAAGIGMGAFNPPRASVAMLVAEPARAGMASGASETFQQIGVALGIAATGSLFQNHVAREFSDSAVGKQLGDSGVDTHTLGVTIANGGAREASEAIPGPLRQDFLRSADSVFVSSMHLCFVVLAVVAGIGAVTALLFIRRRDMREDVPEDVEAESDMSKLAVSDR
ncbi:MFS transporter [Streptomyces sp. NA02950]|uniref:MFS transporter n=1 Tax=Streptomyces sp. NA02950 TaxID=2742137 RepID=UPI0034D0200C